MCMCMCACVHVYKCACVHVCACACVCMCTSVHVCVCVCMCVCMCAALLLALQVLGEIRTKSHNFSIQLCHSQNIHGFPNNLLRFDSADLEEVNAYHFALV